MKQRQKLEMKLTACRETYNKKGRVGEDYDIGGGKYRSMTSEDIACCR